MGDRFYLQTLFEEILGSRNVYFDPPETVKIQYDAIIYRRKKIDNAFANNSVYKQDNCYEVIVISRNPESDVLGRISKLSMCTHDRHYVVNDLHHDAFTIYN